MAGFAAQFIDGTLGMGYGVSSTSLLLAIGLEAFRWGIVAALLIAGVVAAPVAAWVCKELPHRTMGTLIGVLLILLNVRTLVLALVK